eukprot:Partr_v1_DN25753_c0_g1_i1_m74639 putative glycogenin
MVASPSSSSEAFVTLLTSDNYAVGALVLAHSLRDHSTTKQLAVIVSESVSQNVRDQLKAVFDHVIPVESIASTSRENLRALGRPELLFTYTKLQVWNLTQFRKVVFLDADTLVVSNVDDLFAHEELSACPDMGWPDCFNSGVFVATPSAETFGKLMAFAASEGSFDGGDQGILNDFFPNWKRLPFLYNVGLTTSYTYTPAYKRYGANAKILHFFGVDKPWNWSRYSGGAVIPRGNMGLAVELVQKWWNCYDKHFAQPSLQAIQGSGHSIQYSSPHSSSSATHDNQGGNGQQSQAASGGDPGQNSTFFKSRYEWNETEFKQFKGTPAKKMSPDLEQEKKLPLKNKSGPASPAKK